MTQSNNMGGVQSGLASAISRKRKGADDDSDDEKTPFMLNKRAQAERAAREAATKAEAARSMTSCQAKS